MTRSADFPRQGTVDADEVARFSALAAEWWDEDGRLRPLHSLNPVRLAWLRDRLCAHFGRDPRSLRPFAGLSMLDVGCGGGLISEPLARMGAAVTGIDAAADNVRVAALHAADGGLAIDYREGTAEALAAAGTRFDAVVALEIVEHVADRDLFLAALAALARPGGALVLATLNRTVKSFLLAIAGAEYVLGWLPRGTHRWDRFVRPSELAAGLGAGGARIAALTGVSYDAPAGDWRLSRDVAVNYMAFAVRDAGRGGTEEKEDDE